MIFIMNAGHSHLICDNKENGKQTENNEWLCSVFVMLSMKVQKGQANLLLWAILLNYCENQKFFISWSPLQKELPAASLKLSALKF